METIFKYTLGLADKQVVSVPKEWDFLDFQEQNGQIVFWMQGSPEQILMTDEVFYIVGTGQLVPKKAHHYHASVQVGDFVWHIYQEIF